MTPYLPIGESVTPPQTSPARGGLEADVNQTHLNESEQAEPVPEFEFDQTVSW